MESSFFLENHYLCGYNNIVCVTVSRDSRQGTDRPSTEKVRGESELRERQPGPGGENGHGDAGSNKEVENAKAV